MTVFHREGGTRWNRLFERYTQRTVVLSNKNAKEVGVLSGGIYESRVDLIVYYVFH